MIKLVLDIGNTRIKAACWNNKQLIRKYDDTSFSFLASDKAYIRNKFPEALLISSVRKDRKIPKLLASRFQKVITLNYLTRLPVKNLYLTPVTLGNDRIANAAGAAATFHHTPVLVIDAGTCIKYDFVNAKGHYKGGSISPGLQMRFDALHHFTDGLPLLKPDLKFHLTGATTKDAITAGVQAGILAEAEAVMEMYKKKYRGIKFILTGGDYRFFAGNLKKHIFVAPNLTLLGLNEILDFNIH
jgi:type III pantothenate kinase